MCEYSCIMCLYSDPDYNMDDILSKYTKNNYFRCNHQNSPYFEELVYEDTTCRLFIDEKEYFMMKDRRDKIENLKKR